MIQALAWRQAMGAARLPAVWAAALFHVAVLVAFMFVWGTGIPVAGARSPFEQFATAQSALLLIVLPWLVARCAHLDGRNTVAHRAVSAAGRPAMLMLGAGAGLALIAIAVAATGLPLALLSLEISAGTALQLAVAQSRVAALAACAATVTSATVAMSGSRLGGWLIGVAATSGVAWLAPAGPGGALALAVVAATVAIATAFHAGQFWQYRAEYRT